MRKLMLSGVAVVVVGLLGAGCGSGEGGTISAALSRSQFINQADEICSKFSKRREAAFAAWKEGFVGGYEEASQNLDEGFKELVAPSVQHQAEALKALSPPEKDEAKVIQILEDLSEAGEAIAEEGMSGLRRPSKMADFEDAAAAFGMKVCPNP